MAIDPTGDQKKKPSPGRGAKKKKKGPVAPTYYLPFFRELASGLIEPKRLKDILYQIKEVEGEKRVGARKELSQKYGINGCGQAWR